MNESKKKKVKSQLRVNGGSNAGQWRFNAGQTSGKCAIQTDPDQVAGERHMHGLVAGSGAVAERVGRPVPKHADPQRFLTLKQHHLTPHIKPFFLFFLISASLPPDLSLTRRPSPLSPPSILQGHRLGSYEPKFRWSATVNHLVGSQKT